MPKIESVEAQKLPDGSWRLSVWAYRQRVDTDPAGYLPILAEYRTTLASAQSEEEAEDIARAQFTDTPWQFTETAETAAPKSGQTCADPAFPDYFGPKPTCRTIRGLSFGQGYWAARDRHTCADPATQYTDSVCWIISAGAPRPVISETCAVPSDATPISDFEIVDHGIDGSQYFQGCGVAFTDFDECFTGCGDNPREAMADALEAAAGAGFDLSSIEEAEKPDQYPETPSVSARIEEEREAQRSWIVRFVGYCGMTLEEETYTDRTEAREAAAEILRKRRRTYAVQTLDTGERWEILEPEDNTGRVPDACGILSLEENEPEESFMDDSELNYYVSIRIKEAEEAPDGLTCTETQAQAAA